MRPGKWQKGFSSLNDQREPVVLILCQLRKNARQCKSVLAVQTLYKSGAMQIKRKKNTSSWDKVGGISSIIFYAFKPSVSGVR